eukprot:GHVH01000218.1.p1 GENE.GHVH01000218.1~~GHVH01000218.1.p1  ORF type:complete len:618 (+),score=98.98 GHVH01000218.1:52-1905(+)
MFHQDETLVQLAERLQIDSAIVKVLTDELKFTHATVCQEKAWTAALNGKTVYLMSATGSGKTLAFGVPLIQKVLSSRSLLTKLPKRFRNSGITAEDVPLGVVLVPTKELAAQISSFLSTELLQKVPFTNPPSVSDVSSWHASYLLERARLMKKKKNNKSKCLVSTTHAPSCANIIVGTPLGVRDWVDVVCDHLQSSLTNDQLLSNVRMLVVDESDAIFNQQDPVAMQSTEKAVSSLCSWVGAGSTTAPVQGFVSSATLAPGIEKLRGMLCHNPVEIRVDPRMSEPSNSLTAFSNRDQVEETFIKVDLQLPSDRFLFMYGLILKRVLYTPSIIFTNSTNQCMKITILLRQFGFRVNAIFDEMTVASRKEIINSFSRGVSEILVFSDKGVSHEMADDEADADKCEDENLSIRGIDFGGRVATVINFELPFDYETYVHRIGRCGRGGEEGVCVSFIDTPTTPEWFLDEIESGNVVNLDDGGNIRAQCATFKYRVEDVLGTLNRSVMSKAKSDEVNAAMSMSERLKKGKFADGPAGKRKMREYLKDFALSGGDIATRVPEGVPLVRNGEVRLTTVKSRASRIASGKWQEKFDSGIGPMRKRVNVNFKKKGSYAAKMRKKTK